MARKQKRKQPGSGTVSPRTEPANAAPPSATEPAANATPMTRAQRVAVVAMIAVASVAFVTFIYTYAAMGEPFVNGLDERVGEVLSARAARLAQGYRFDDAIATYEQALSAGFEREPDHRIFAMRALIELLEREGRTERLIEVAQETLALRPDYGPAFLALFRALRESKRYDAALAMLADQHAQAKKAGAQARLALIKFNEGVIHEDLGDSALAAAAFQESFDAEPSARCALRAIQALCSAGQKDAVTTLVQYVLDNGNPSERKSAQTFAEACGESSAP